MSTRKKLRQIIGDGSKILTVDATLCGSLKNTQKEIHRVAASLSLKVTTRTTPRSIICWFTPKGS